jgi:hypothetical protein
MTSNALQDRSEILFESIEGSVQELRLGNYDQVQARPVGLIAPEDLSNQTLSSIPGRRAAEPPRSGDAEAGTLLPVWARNDRYEPAAHPRP